MLATDVVVERLTAVVCGREDDGTLYAGELIADKVRAFTAGLPRAARVAISGQLFVLDQSARVWPSARGRRLADLDEDLADRFLGLMLGGRVPGGVAALRGLKQIVALCYYDLPPVRERVGFHPDPHIALVAHRRLEAHGDEIRRAEQAVTGAAPPDRTQPEVVDRRSARDRVALSCDVVIVGTGAGGATMAAELADAGVDVVMLDEGGYHPTESFGTDVVRAFGTLYRSGGAQTILGKPPITFLEGRCVGGSTVVNGGMCWRTPPEVLARWTSECGVEGVAADEMERHFAAVEELLSIRPQDPDSIGRDAQLLEQGAHALGWKINRSPRNQLHCCGCDNCLFGCPTGAKQSMLVTNVPRALAAGARLVADCKVERITRAGKRATGVEGLLAREPGRPPIPVTVRAPVVVVACGGLQTPALLARSGFRSHSGELGRNLTLHPSAVLVALFDDEVNGWQGAHQAFQVTEFLDEGILVTASTVPPALVAANVQQNGSDMARLMGDYSRMVVAGCLVEDRTSGRVRNVPGVGPVGFYNITEADSRRVVRGLSLSAEVMFAAGARRVGLPLAGAGMPMDQDETRRFLAGPIRRGAHQLVTVHAMGTARMSEDRGRGVVSSYGEFHGAAGLFVADSSILPGPLGVNPMETIVALVRRNAERMVDERTRHGI